MIMPVLGELAKNPPGDPQKKKSMLGLCEKPSVSKVRYFCLFNTVERKGNFQWIS